MISSAHSAPQAHDDHASFTRSQKGKVSTSPSRQGWFRRPAAALGVQSYVVSCRPRQRRNQTLGAFSEMSKLADKAK